MWEVSVIVIDKIIPATDVTLDRTELPEVENGYGTVTLDATVTPDNAAPGGVIWTSSNPLVATVDENGTVQGVGEGEATITATAKAKLKDEAAPFATCKVTVIPRVTYTLSFNANGGTLPDDFTSMPIKFGTQVGTLPVPVMAGRVFDGWFMDEEEGQPEIKTGDTVTTKEDRTAYAHWTYKYQAAVPAADIGTAGSDKPTEVKAGTRVALKSATEGSAIYYKLYTSAEAADAGQTTLQQLASAWFETENTTDAAAEEAAAAAARAEGILRYEDVVSLTETMADEETRIVVLQAVALKENFKPSAVVRYSYKLRDTSKDWGDLIDTEGKTDEEIAEEIAQIEAEIGDRNGDTKFDAHDIPKDLWLLGITDVDYDGTAKTQPGLRVFHHTKLLTPGTDYTVKYAKNKNAGTATVTITGKKSYTGKVVREFTIRQRDIAVAAHAMDALVEGGKLNAHITLPWNGKVQKGKVVLTDQLNGKTVTLKENRDYTLDYSAGGFVEPGTYTITVKGKGNYTNYTEKREVRLEITNAKPVSKLSVARIPNQEYQNGDPVEPLLTVKDGETVLTKGDGYEAEYANNTAPGTATVTIIGKGAYAGAKTVSFRINGTPMKKVKVDFDVSLVAGYTAKGFPYTGQPYEPAGPAKKNETDAEPATVTNVKLTNKVTGEALQRGKDFTITYSNNTEPGTATVLFTGIGGYTGTVKKTFKIKAHNLAAETPDGGKIKVYFEKEGTPTEWKADDTKDDDPAYGYVKGGVKPEPVVKFEYPDPEDAAKTVAIILQKGTDYTLSYKNNNKPGNRETVNKKGKSIAPTVTIRGKKTFTGSITRTFTIAERPLAERSEAHPDGLTVSATDIVYRNKAGICKPKVTVTDANGKKLAAGTDYEKKITFTYVYDTEVTVKDGTEYRTEIRSGETAESAPGAGNAEPGDEVGKGDIIQAGTVIRATVTGKGYYSGTISTTFRFVKGDVSKAKVTFTKAFQESLVYDGRPVVPEKKDIEKVIIGSTVLKNTDYEIVSCENNDRAGTAKVTIRGTGSYGGTKTVSFKIAAKSLNYTISYENNRAVMLQRLASAYGITEEEAEKRFVFSGNTPQSSTPPGGKLANNRFKIYDNVSKAWLTFGGWTLTPDKTGLDFQNTQAFRLTGFQEQVFGTDVTLYANWMLPAAKWGRILFVGDSRTADMFADSDENITGTVYDAIAVYGGHGMGISFLRNSLEAYGAENYDTLVSWMGANEEGDFSAYPAFYESVLASGKKLVLCTVGPTSDVLIPWFGKPKYSNSNMIKYNEKLIEWAAAHGVEVIDLYTFVKKNIQMDATDGIHYLPRPTKAIWRHVLSWLSE